MVPKLLISIVIFSIGLVHGQLVQLLLPQALNSFNGAIVNRTESVEILNNIIDGEFFAKLLRFLTSVVLSVAWTMDTDRNVQNLLIDNIKVSKRASFIRDYNFGLQQEDWRLNNIQLIEKHGFTAETHEAVTEDGYVLTLFRIRGDGPVVFLMHGLSGSADDYVASGPESGIAYLLAKDGYDVWMGNARGTKHSFRHVQLKPSQAKFWDFSWHEIGYFDLPAMIDYTLNATRKDNLKYIGHSQGTTSFWVMCSERPDYNDKVSLMIALAPVAFMNYAQSPILRGFVSVPGLVERFSSKEGSKMYMRQSCGDASGPLYKLFCVNFLLFTAGFNLNTMDASILPVVLGHASAGSSVKQSVHYAQEIISGKFRRFDYGVTQNIRRYGFREPPSYKLMNVKTPVALIYSDADWLSDARDVEKLADSLPNVSILTK
ncbi:lipase 3-like [Leguminivora glycinivorella]|uniref:lipase 3-like n=1 Tax=Leguminivora glycinivorella TaxID=1035111 RepID=UPI00200F0485|nr:lipase 3-like [Leguminivora glycinivorella]